MPIEYDRGVEGTRVTLAFEIQEAISFRNAVAAALADISPELLARDPAATRELTTIVAGLGRTLDAAVAGRAASAEAVRARTDRALELIDDLYPDSWKEAATGADFDVIAASIDRLAAAAKAGSWSRAEQARLEAYGIFELGPEQRLRGIAPSLFQRIEGLFWYGDGGQAGLVQLVKRKDAGAELEESVAALQAELEQAAQRVGSSSSTAAVISNSAIVVFREGLEAVLILAALMASMVGINRRYRRPLLAGAAIALAASAVTWVIAQTVLGSLALYGEKLEAIVSVIAIGVLLLILNWFYHRVYWSEHLADFHKRKQRILRGSHVGFISAQVLGLAALGFSSVYREGFETVLFLQAMTLEAGILAVLPGVMLGLAATLAVGGLTILLERKLPHRKMLIATGILMTWVLVILVGTTVQTFQVVGWMPVTPIEGLQLPYWTGAWLGIYPTWEGVAAQVGAAAFVIGSYVAAEQVRARKRRRILSSVPNASAATSELRPQLEPELGAVRAGVDRLQLLHALDVVARLGELDPAPLFPPAVDVRLAGVVGGERELLVLVLVEQVAQVPGAVADVQLRVDEVALVPAAAAGAVGDPLRGRGQELHQADCAGAGHGIGLELRLLVDHGREQVRLEVVVLGVPDDDLLVRERVAHPLVPARLRLEHVERERRDDRAEDADRGELHPVSSRITPATHSSSSSSVPVFTYAKSARCTFSLSGSSRWSRSSRVTRRRCSRSLAGAVITTTLSKRLSPPVS